MFWLDPNQDKNGHARLIGKKIYCPCIGEVKKYLKSLGYLNQETELLNMRLLTAKEK